MAPLTANQTLALMLAASIDPRLAPVQRANARETAEGIDAPRAWVVPGLLRGPLLTEEGIRKVLSLLPEPGPHLLPRVVEDLLRTLRGAGRPCSDVRLTEDGGGFWTLRWEGEGWADFALAGQGRLPSGMKTRGCLASSVVALGMEVLEDGPTWVRFGPPAPVADVDEDDLGSISAEDEDDAPRPWKGEYLRAARAEADPGDGETLLDRLTLPKSPRSHASVDEMIAVLEGTPYVPSEDDLFLTDRVLAVVF